MRRKKKKKAGLFQPPFHFSTLFYHLIYSEKNMGGGYAVYLDNKT